MRRADRLFQIIQILRRSTRPVTAAALAEELEVSKRTVYRDMADLIGQRVPVDGEAGLGYLLDSDYDMPPLMLTPDEPSVGARPGDAAPGEGIDTARLRSAIREGLKLRLRYRSEAGEETERTVWPIILGYAEASRLLVAWCELRQSFRHFRTDRMIEAEVMDEPYGMRKGELRRRWQRWREMVRSRRTSD